VSPEPIRACRAGSGRAVVDRTGLTGNWDFEMKYATRPPNGALPPGVELPPPDPDAPDPLYGHLRAARFEARVTKEPD